MRGRLLAVLAALAFLPCGPFCFSQSLDGTAPWGPWGQLCPLHAGCQPHLSLLVS